MNATTVIADFIFPAFATPYFTPLFFPVAAVAAIGTEWFCYRRFSSNARSPHLGDIILANLVSWFCGYIFAASFLPSGLINKPDGQSGTFAAEGPHFATFALIAFFVAWILSIVIEFWSLRWSTRKHSVQRLFRLSAIANTAGYLVLGIMIWVEVSLYHHA